MMAFVRRGFLMDASYKFVFVSRVATVLLAIFVLHFASQLVDAGRPAALAKYGGSYFQFAVVGVAMSQYFAQALYTSADSLRRAQLSGVLEAILSSETRPAHVVLCDSAYGFLSASVNFLTVSAIGVLSLGASFGQVNPLGVLLSIGLGTTAIASLGIFSAAWTVAFKSGDPIPLLVGGVGSLVSGVYFPVSLLPRPVRLLSEILPATHALEATRLALSSEATWTQIARPLSILAVMTAILLPASLWCFEAAVSAARRNGTLLHY